jgi:hypothetical protein
LAEYERFLGKIIDYDAKLNTLIIKVDFLTPDKQAIIENLFKDRQEFTFWFSKPFRKLKTYPQLKKYFALIKKILIKSEIYPDAEVVKTLDIEIKKSVLPCKQLEINEHVIPIVPSKADLDVDTMAYLIQEVIDRYGVE